MESYYSAREMADMHFMCGFANGNSREARHLSAKYYPQCKIPFHKLATKYHQRLSESGSLAHSLNAHYSAIPVPSQMPVTLFDACIILGL
jgi:hypothetical protein